MKNMKLDKIKIILVGIVISLGLAYGFSDDLKAFIKYSILGGIGYSGLVYYINNRKQTDKRVLELESMLEKKKIDDRVETLESLLQESDGVISEQEEVIKNYEMMLEEASVKFPCNCGQNMFDGIFKPNEEVVVDCDYCNAKYSLILKMESVLISEPLNDLDIDKLIKENVK